MQLVQSNHNSSSFSGFPCFLFRSHCWCLLQRVELEWCKPNSKVTYHLLIKCYRQSYHHWRNLSLNRRHSQKSLVNKLVLVSQMKPGGTVCLVTSRQSQSFSKQVLNYISTMVQPDICCPQVIWLVWFFGFDYFLQVRGLGIWNEMKIRTKPLVQSYKNLCNTIHFILLQHTHIISEW